MREPYLRNRMQHMQEPKTQDGLIGARKYSTPEYSPANRLTVFRLKNLGAIQLSPAYGQDGFRLRWTPSLYVRQHYKLRSFAVTALTEYLVHEAAFKEVMRQTRKLGECLEPSEAVEVAK